MDASCGFCGMADSQTDEKEAYRLRRKEAKAKQAPRPAPAVMPKSMPGVWKEDSEKNLARSPSKGELWHEMGAGGNGAEAQVVQIAS